MKLAYIGPLTLLLALSRLQQSSTIVEGIVVKASNSTPLSGVGVELMRIDGDESYVSATAGDGHFRFTDVTPGQYRVAAANLGYVRSEYGQRGPHGKGLPVAVAPGQSVRDLHIALVETGAIFGRVYDTSGMPLANVQIQAMRFSYRDGLRLLSSVKTAMTNDLGEYRLFWLPPGRYYVSASPLKGAVPEAVLTVSRTGYGMYLMPPAAGAQILWQENEGTAPVFYPGTLEAQAAQFIDLEAGGNRGGTDIHIGSLTTHRIFGSVHNIPIDPITGQGVRDLLIRLTLRSPADAVVSNPVLPGGVFDSARGTFDIRGVTPGSYYVTISNNPPRQAANRVRVFGRVPVDVWDKDVENVTVALGPGMSLPVQVTMDDGSSLTPAISRLSLALTGGAVAQSGPSAGTFMFSDIAPGEYRITVKELPDDTYVKSVRLGNIDVLSDGFRTTDALDSPIHIVLGTKAGILEGSVLDSARSPVPNATVAIVPERIRQARLELYQSATTDAAGQFRFSGLEPGQYIVLAWEDIPDGAWQYPPAIEADLPQGRTVNITEGSRQATQLTVIPLTK
jgi:protocatechuate 3,4-dioxygenase beta subunit